MSMKDINYLAIGGGAGAIGLLIFWNVVAIVIWAIISAATYLPAALICDINGSPNYSQAANSFSASVWWVGVVIIAIVDAIILYGAKKEHSSN